MSWTDDQKTQAVTIYTRILENEYETDEQRAENATEIVKQVVDELGDGKTINGVRRILSQAGVYIAQKPKTSNTGANSGAKSGGAKLSKADQIQALKDAVLDAVPEGTELDNAIFDKFTGKAAAHLTELFVLANSQ